VRSVCSEPSGKFTFIIGLKIRGTEINQSTTMVTTTTAYGGDGNSNNDQTTIN
jgi:hypothetical protein